MDIIYILPALPHIVSSSHPLPSFFDKGEAPSMYPPTIHSLVSPPSYSMPHQVTAVLDASFPSVAHFWEWDPQAGRQAGRHARRQATDSGIASLLVVGGPARIQIIHSSVRYVRDLRSPVLALWLGI